MHRSLFIIACCFCLHALFPATHGYAQQPRDLAKLFDGIELRLPDSAFIAPPREIVRPLLRCKKLMAEGKFADAVEILGEILADDSIEDFLIPRGTRSFTSLRSRTESILGAIDIRLLEPYRVRYRIRARKLMEKGVAENDLALLKKVSSQFFFTDSGAECTMLLGHMELSNGQPSAAQSYFSKIVRFPATAAQHDPEASILLATCQMLGNNRVAAEETLINLKQRMPNSTISLMGETFTLFNREEDAISWLTSLIGDSPLASNRTLSKWLMFQGNAARTGKTGTGMPLLVPRWEHATTSTLKGQDEVSNYVNELVLDGIMPAPAIQPLVVGDTIVLRDEDHMYGIDFETGLRQWSWPPKLAWNEKPRKEITSAQTLKLKQRMVSDSIYGQASSDGQLIFFVPTPGSSSQYDHDSGLGNAAQSDPTDLRTYNELVAVDSANAGMMRWRIGGLSGFDEPRLAKAYFIGEALPLEGLLYCCCVHDNAIKLVAIDTQTGKLRWDQAIAAYDNSNFNESHIRRLAGVSPSYADGKIVCLTGTGAVVALDISTRTLLWGYEYKLRNETNMVSDDSGYANSLKDAWRDSQVTIANGMVILTPVLSREVICLGLEDGLSVWFEEDGFLPQKVIRESSLYLAGINKDLLIFVGTRDIRAIDSFTGRETWRLDLEIDDMPSGRGYIGDDSLFLPTASRKVLRIDLLKGKMAESIATGRILGNLSRFKGDVISHGIDHVASFPEYGASSRIIEGLSDNDLNEPQKFIKAQTLIQRGELDAGINMLTAIAERNPLEKYASFFESCARNFQSDQPTISLKALDVLKRLYPNFDVIELEQGRAIAKLRTGDFLASVELSLDQLEKQYSEVQQKSEFNISDDSYKTLAAKLFDRPMERRTEVDEAVKGLEQVPFENRNDLVVFSEFGWHRTRLHLAMEGLKANDADGFVAATERICKLVADNVDQPKAPFDWLMDRIPTRTLDTATLELLGKRFLDQKRFLEALMCVDVALETESSEAKRMRLLKAEILFAGSDLLGASDMIGAIDDSALDSVDRERFDSLRKVVAAAIEENAGRIKSPSTWSNVDWPIADVDVAITTSTTEQDPARYRLPLQFDAGTDPHFRTAQMFFCAWGRLKEELELRNSRGNLIGTMQIRKKDFDDSFGYVRFCRVDIQNHVAEFALNKRTLYCDWFSILSGEGGSLWKSEYENLTPSQTAFSGSRETLIGEGRWLYCHETLSGKLIWSRKLKDSISRVVSHDSLVTTWSDEGQCFNTFDVATGRLLRTLKSKRFVVTRSLADKFVMSYPVRKGELPRAEEERLAGTKLPKGTAEVAKRFALFDAKRGGLVWSKVFSLKSKEFYLAKELCVLDSDGKLTFIDLATGSLNSEIRLSLSELEKAGLSGINVRHHRAGWVVHVKSKTQSSQFSRGKSTYEYNLLHSELGSGPVFLLNESRDAMVWSSPAHVEQLEYLNSQPFDSPAIMFGRQIQRTNPVKGETNHMQIVLLDAKTGKLSHSSLVKSFESYNGYSIDWQQPDPTKASNTLVVSTPAEITEIKFGSDAELPPGPRAYLTFNAIDFFEERLFEPVRPEVVDSRVEEFRERALEAEKRRLEQQTKAAAELKQRMGVSGSQ